MQVAQLLANTIKIIWLWPQTIISSHNISSCDHILLTKKKQNPGTSAVLNIITILQDNCYKYIQYVLNLYCCIMPCAIILQYSLDPNVAFYRRSINCHRCQINDSFVQKEADHLKSPAQWLEPQVSCDNSCRKRRVCVSHFLMVTQPMRLETEREEPRPRCAWWKTLDLTNGILQGKAETCLITPLSVLLCLP